MVIKWSVAAAAELKKTFEYISKDSPQNANKVVNDLLGYTNKLAGYPMMYPPDKYKVENNGNWRAFELHRYRVSYFISPNEIVIVRLRHTSMSPLLY